MSVHKDFLFMARQKKTQAKDLGDNTTQEVPIKLKDIAK
jgi:hypothetical protein